MKTWRVIGSCSVLAMAAMSARAADYCDTEVPTVIPGATVGAIVTAPSDAIVLFDGRDLLRWKGRDGAAAWDVRDGVVTVKKGTGDIETKDSFRDIQLHIEWRIPADITGQGQLRGNSGIFLQGRYELQVLDSYQNPTYSNGLAGAIYGQSAPSVNATRKPGEWNVFDVIYTAPRFNEDGTLYAPARMTVLQNGVLVQNNFEIQGNTGPWGKPGYYEPASRGPIRLQDHPDPSKPISYRNIWVRELGVLRARAVPMQQSPAKDALSVVSSVPLKELLDDSATREVLARCLPDLVPTLGTSATVNKMTLTQLQQYVVNFTDEKLQRIAVQLARARDKPAGQ